MGTLSGLVMMSRKFGSSPPSTKNSAKTAERAVAERVRRDLFALPHEQRPARRTIRRKYSRGSATALKMPLIKSIVGLYSYMGPLMPPSLRTRQKCTAISTAMPSGSPTQCST